MSKPIAPFIIAVAAFLAVIGGGIAIFEALSTGSSAPPSNSQTANSGSGNSATLKPATVPPKVSECSANLSYASDGNPAPLTCSGGELNVLAWNALAALEPTVMKLGYTPTSAQVASAICVDGNDADVDSSAAISAPLETSAYQLASLYYGWSFSINPTALLDGGC